jgi:hypothetical protein
MIQDDFNKLLDAIYEHRIKGVMCKKSAEYARGGDKLYNFYRAASMSEKTPIECLRGMKLKHDVSVDDMLNDEAGGKEHSQALWTEKLGDKINYLLLLWALLHEKYDWEFPPHTKKITGVKQECLVPIKIDRVYVDLDGVLVDFVAGVHEAFGVNYSCQNYPYKPGMWDMLEDIPRPGATPLKNGVSNFFSFAEINDACTKKFWQNLLWTHDGHDIWREIFFKAGNKLDKLVFLTTPMPNSESYEGKVKWVELNVPLMEKRTVITVTPKSNFASPTSLLIDDKDTNVEEFRAAGGHAILINRPWNKGHEKANDTYAEFVKDLKRFTI